MSDVDFELFERLIRESRDESRATREELGGRMTTLESKVQDGFASLRAHDFAHHTDIGMMEQRLADLEQAVERLNHAQGINADP